MRAAFILPGVFGLFLLGHAFLAANEFSRRAEWMNVPPAPGQAGALVMSLGDAQFSFRTINIMLQNLGNIGGRWQKLEDYNYQRLGEWFFLADELDPKSNYTPLLAGYYFSATKKPEDLTPVIEYLARAGEHPQPEKWRWLAQAVYLARFKQNDLAKASTLADQLSAEWHEGRPLWMKQMKAFILADAGSREAAYDLMMGILKEDIDNLRPEEINFMTDYICNRILTPDEAIKNPVCAEQTGLP